ncbi:hypothetical protein KC207_00210 [Phycicoccus sp. BSK3Z-2]|uniref:Uncharacterized protein n=1 Tax=Phycicoccus avicenniae TaxID=2828860 RepID=A0A941D877_9MICO|nr:hypothetical protein [Phycicoccus avicenniae]MBR7741717.1 hypothetical protein [Phycicoccus avicenniae]
MTGSLVVVPSAPLLLPEYTGRLDAGADLRRSAVEAVAAATDADGTDAVLLVVATDREPRTTRSPLGERVGRHLADLAGVSVAGVVTVAWDASVDDCRELGREEAAGPSPTLVVVADGSARRSEKAPGHLDDRAAGFDDALVAALRDADLEAVLRLDPGLAADLLAHGRAPLQVGAATLVAREGEVTCAGVAVDDAFGVLHVVARLALA